MPATGIQNSLRERGVRLTRQRRILLDLLDRSGKHLNAEALYQLAKEKDPKLNRVTVYRTQVLKAGVVDELDLLHLKATSITMSRLKQEPSCLRTERSKNFSEALQKMRRQMESNLGFKIVQRAQEMVDTVPIASRSRAGLGRKIRAEQAGWMPERPAAALGSVRRASAAGLRQMRFLSASDGNPAIA